MPSEHRPDRSDGGMDYLVYLVNQITETKILQFTAIILASYF